MATQCQGLNAGKEPINSRTTTVQQASQPAPIESMPYDVMHLLFQLTGLHDATVLGLTCPKFYAYLKLYHKDPIPLEQDLWLDPAQCRVWTRNFWGLGSHGVMVEDLQVWKGLSGYRLVDKPTCRFVNVAVYGKREYPHRLNMKEKALQDRFKDYRLSRSKTIVHYSNRAPMKHPGAYPLPSPHNMGNEWYRAVFDIIERSFDDFSTKDGGSSAWREHWSWFRVMEKNQQYFKAVSAYMKGPRLASQAAELAIQREIRLCCISIHEKASPEEW